MTWNEMLNSWRAVFFIMIGIPMLIIVMFEYILPLSQYIINKEIFILKEDYERITKENSCLIQVLKDRGEENDHNNLL